LLKLAFSVAGRVLVSQFPMCAGALRHLAIDSTYARSHLVMEAPMVERLIFPTFLLLALIGSFMAIAVRAPVVPKHPVPGAIFPSFVAMEADALRG
jgi:hypothetical protein